MFIKYIHTYVYRIYIPCLFICYVYMYINKKIELNIVTHCATKINSFTQNILIVKRQK